MLEVPDITKFGRPEQLHASLWGIIKYLNTNGNFPSSTSVHACKLHVEEFIKDSYDIMDVEIDDDIFAKAV